MRFYLSGPLNDQQMDDLSLRFASDAGDYRKDSSGFFIEIRHQHLDLAPEEIISKELMKLSMMKVTLMVGSGWVLEKCQADGTLYSHEDATASFRWFVEGKFPKATVLITGPTLDSVLKMLKKLKDGDLNSHQDVRKELAETIKAMVETAKYEERLRSTLQDYETKIRRLEEEVEYFRLPWYRRMGATRTVNVIPYRLSLVRRKTMSIMPEDAAD